MINYKENIQKLRSGTALSSAEFIDTIKARHHKELGLDVKIIHLDHSLFEDIGYKKEKQPIPETAPSQMEEQLRNALGNNGEGDKHTFYAENTRSILLDDIQHQMQQLGDEEIYIEEFIDRLGASKQHFNHYIESMERNEASMFDEEFKNKPISFIVHEQMDQTLKDELSNITGWDEDDVKYTNNHNPHATIITSSHEEGHSYLMFHLERDNPFPQHEDNDYNSYIHECVADLYTCLDDIHDGGNKETLKKMALERAYNAIIPYESGDGKTTLDYKHFTSPTLLHLYNDLDEEYVQLLSKREMAEYAMKLVIGDEHEGRDPAYLSYEAFIEAKNTAQDVSNLVENFCGNGKRPIPTPKQFETAIEQAPESFLAHEAHFIERYITPHKNTMVHAHDVALGLTTQERFDNPQIVDDMEKETSLFNKVPQSNYEEHLQNLIYPINEDGDMLNLTTEEQLDKIYLEERFISRGGEHMDLSKEQALDVLKHYQEALLTQEDQELQKSPLQPKERAEEIAIKGHYLSL